MRYWIIHLTALLAGAPTEILLSSSPKLYNVTVGSDVRLVCPGGEVANWAFNGKFINYCNLVSKKCNPKKDIFPNVNFEFNADYLDLRGVKTILSGKFRCTPVDGTPTDLTVDLSVHSESPRYSQEMSLSTSLVGVNRNES
ncbi:hypothetical protein Ciccas_009731 [Cichlidogyrus casuarinus]|uniref:Immunoglobulin subtype domain-containing protein n=1 Tax=Cichlidogyrus casuarinus TaxID=1844966 RepID=A0ABD2PW61_9PLAT